MKLAAGISPKRTPLAPVNPLPVMVTVAPPAVVPVAGLKLVMAGPAAAVTVNWSALTAADVPLGVVTVMSITPAPCGGAVAVICVSELTVKLLLWNQPNETTVAPVKLVPVMVTLAPPALVPVDGLMPVTAGTGGDIQVN